MSPRINAHEALVSTGLKVTPTMLPVTKLYGTWSSPISPRQMGSMHRLLDVQWDTSCDALIWLEQHPGSSVLTMQRGHDAPRNLTEYDQTPRARIGYGGGDFTVHRGVVCFAGAGGRLYIQSVYEGRARPITPAFGQTAAPRIAPDGGWVLAVHEYERSSSLILVPADGSQFPVRLVSGDDFYMQPTWHPDGRHIAFIAWNHPRMPWDGTELRLAALAQAGHSLIVQQMQVIAGGDDISVFQPEFSPDGRFLAFISDELGWWQLYVYDLHTREIRRLTTDEAEYGQPAWIQGLRMYGWTDRGQGLIALRNQAAAIRALHIDVASGKTRDIATEPYTNLLQIAVHPERPAFAAIASAPTIPDRIIQIDTQPLLPLTLSSVSAGETPGIMVLTNAAPESRIVHRSSTENVIGVQLSPGQHIAWKSIDGDTAYGIFYPPHHERFAGVGLPPLIIHVHGGPTSQTRLTYSADAQFYATRGFAILQVNHRGSTGYGKAYKDLGRESWGIYEVEDSIAGARHLAEAGLIDLDRVIILGSSSGGFAVLYALVTRPGFFRAGVCTAGIADQFSLIKDGVDKFEERYLETIIGKLPEALPAYRERSPLFHADRIADPLILFHGEEDTIVHPDNSRQIAAALQARGVPCELYLYPGEGHSLRRPENIEDYYRKTLAFIERYVIYR